VQKEADKTASSLDQIGSAKAKLAVDDKAVVAARKEIGRLRDEVAKTLEADVTADTSKAQRRIRQLQSSIKTLSQTKITPEVKPGKFAAFKAGLSDVGAKLKTFGAGAADAFKAIGVPVLGAVGVAAAGLATSIGALGVKSLTLADNLDQAKISFVKFLGSADKADAFLTDLRGLAAKTPFEFPELVDSSKKLLAFGVAGKDVVSTMTTLGDAASLTGNSVEDLAEIYGQMVAKGKVSNEELLQLTERGIPAYKILADALGKSAGEVEKLASEGKLGADALKKLMAGIDEGFGGGMAKQAQTLGGMISTLKDTFNGILTDIGTALLPIAKGIFPALQKGAEGIGAKVTGALPQIVDMVAGAVTALLQLPGTVLRGLATISQGFAGMVAGIQTSIADLVSGIAQAMDAIPGVKAEDLAGLRTASDSLRASADESRRLGGEGFDKLTTAADKADAAVDPLVKKIEEARLKTQTSLKLQMDTTAIDQKLTKVNDDLKKFKANRANPKLDADKSFWDRKIKAAQAQKERLEKKKVSIKFDADAAPLKRKISSANSQIAALRKKKATPQINATIEGLKKKKAQALHELATLTVKKSNPKLNADSKEFKKKVADTERKLKATDKKKAEPKIKAKDETAAGVNSAKKSLNSVHDKNVTITTTYRTVGKKPSGGGGGGGASASGQMLLLPVPTLDASIGQAFASALTARGGAAAVSRSLQPAAAAVAGPSIVIAVRDERLADLIDVRVDGRAVAAARIVHRKDLMRL
jgi:tape measure domain-containing protein